MGYDSNTCIFCQECGGGQYGCCHTCCAVIDDNLPRVNHEIGQQPDYCGNCSLCGGNANYKMITICDGCFERNQNPHMPERQNTCLVCYLERDSATQTSARGELPGCDCDIMSEFCGNCMSVLLVYTDCDNKTVEVVSKRHLHYTISDKNSVHCNMCTNICVFRAVVCNVHLQKIYGTYNESHDERCDLGSYSAARAAGPNA